MGLLRNKMDVLTPKTQDKCFTKHCFQMNINIMPEIGAFAIKNI